MNAILLTKGITLDPIVYILGNIANAIYNSLYALNFPSLVACEILLTTIVVLLLLPATIKRYKMFAFTKYLKPELEAIMKKYEDRTDLASLACRDSDIKEAHERYGFKPVVTQILSLVEFPVMFELFRTIYYLPNYITLDNTSSLSIINTPFSMVVNGSYSGHALLVVAGTLLPLLWLATKYLSGKLYVYAFPHMDKKKSPKTYAKAFACGVIVGLLFVLPAGICVCWIAKLVLDMILLTLSKKNILDPLERKYAERAEAEEKAL